MRQNLVKINSLLLFVHICFWISILVNALFWVLLFAKIIPFKQQKHVNNFFDTVDIIVVFQNEWDRLKLLIPSLLAQKYEAFQVHLQDDFSDDYGRIGTDFINDKRIKYYKTMRRQTGKKQALKEAIDESEATLILLTDADCMPLSDSWLASMVGTLSQETDIVLGYSPTEKTKGMVNLFSRFETWLTAVQYMSYALAKMPYMGVGRNMMYRRSLAENFNSNTSLPSGDDDLFIQAVSTKKNVRINLDPNAFIVTESKSSWMDFINQKRRHVTTAPHYRWIHKLLLSMYSVSQILMYIFGLILLIWFGLWSYWWVFLVVLCLKMVVAFPIMKRMKEADLWIYFPVLDFMLSLYFVILGLFMLIKPYKKW